MSTKRFLRCVLFLALSGGIAGISHATTVPDLQRLLQAAPKGVLSYYEIRESPWLDHAVESRGTMLSNAGVLEKRVESPRQETWRLLPDRMEWSAPGSAEWKRIEFSAAPALAVLSNTLRQLVAGNLLALEKDYRIELRGDDHSWSAQLEPIRSDVRQYLKYLKVSGKGNRLQAIEIVDNQDERTTTYLNPIGP